MQPYPDAVSLVVGVLVSLGLIVCACYKLYNLRGDESLLQILPETIFMIVSAMISLYLLVRETYATYFGFLVSWTGRATYYVLIGSYFLPLECAGGCKFEGAQGVCTVTMGTCILLGLVLLILRTVIMSNYQQASHHAGEHGLPLDLVAVLSAVASFGMLVLGVIILLSVGNKKMDNIVALYWVSRGIFLTLIGSISLVSACYVSGWVCTFFGFLYTLLGRGCFYLLAGCYTLPLALNLKDSPNMWEKLCWIASVVSIVMGIVYIVWFVHIYQGGGGGGGCCARGGGGGGGRVMTVHRTQHVQMQARRW